MLRITYADDLDSAALADLGSMSDYLSPDQIRQRVFMIMQLLLSRRHLQRKANYQRGKMLVLARNKL